MNVAVVGCLHGELDQMYSDIDQWQQQQKKKVDLLLCCGDFEAIRDGVDLDSMAVPDKYKTMGTFQDYYLGKKMAPVLTIIIGGNHEASYYMRELYYGGWVAQNIYYVGASGIIDIVAKIKIKNDEGQIEDKF